MTSTLGPARATEPLQQHQALGSITATAQAPPPTAIATAAGPTSASTGEDQTKEIAPFLRSLRRMLDRESDAILCWTPDGRAFEIHDMEVMTSYILPKYFKHAKYTSFQRQLNYFNFRKWTKSRAVVCTFSNAFFVRDQPDLTWRITRKRGLSDAKSASDSGASPRSPKPPKPRASSGTASAPTASSAGVAAASKPVAIKRESSSSKRKAPSAPSSSARKVAKVSPSARSVKVEPLARASDVGVESLEWVDTLYPSLETLEAECSTNAASLSPSPMSSPIPSASPSVCDASELSGSSGPSIVGIAPISVGYNYGAPTGLGSSDSGAYSGYSYSNEHVAYAWPQYSPSVEDADRFRSAAAYFAPTVVQTSCVAL